MEVFRSLKFYLKLFGILQWQLPAPFDKVPITLMQRFVVIVSILNAFLTSTWFLFYEDKQFNEFAESLNISLTSLILIVWYLISLWKQAQIEYFLNYIQRTIQNRNCFVHIFKIFERVHFESFFLNIYRDE